MNEKEIEKSAKQHAKRDTLIVKRDFLEDLPSNVAACLDSLYWEYRNCDWFEKAWNDYRDQVINTPENKMPKLPGYIFNPYIEKHWGKIYKDEQKNMTECVKHSLEEGDITEEMYIEHHGVKGQKHGVRRYQNEDGSLTPEGRIHYGVGDGNKSKSNENENPTIVVKEKSKPGDELTTKEMKQIMDDANTRKQWKQFVEGQKGPSAGETAAEASATVLRGVQDISNQVRNAIPNEPGTKKYAKFPDMSDQELQARINRLSLEQRYSDMTGQTKYIKSGQEQTREFLQTFGAIAGVGASIATVVLAIVKATKKS